MKNRICIVTVLVVSVLALNSCTTISFKKEKGPATKETRHSEKTGKHQIIGKWNADARLSYEFDSDGYAKIYMGEQVIGGSDLFSGSALKYEIDYSKDPVTLDLIHIDKSNNEERNRMAMIIKFLSANKIKIKTFNSSERPEKFEENDENVFTMNRDTTTGNKTGKKEKE
ncbi:MAG: hypothetical protein ACUZ8H_15205 [Candidatus Anammoxibacter sp.]